MKEVDPENFNPQAEARASPLIRAAYPLIMAFVSVILAFAILEIQWDPGVKILLGAVNLTSALYWAANSYRNYMLHYWFRQLVFSNERHKKHVEDGSFQACACRERMKECILEWKKYS